MPFKVKIFTGTEKVLGGIQCGVGGAPPAHWLVLLFQHPQQLTELPENVTGLLGAENNEVQSPARRGEN